MRRVSPEEVREWCLHSTTLEEAYNLDEVADYLEFLETRVKELNQEIDDLVTGYCGVAADAN